VKYCSVCASEVEHKIPAGDNRVRAVCPNCATVHYVNPKIVVGTIPVWQGRILLCKRAIEPRHGFWTLPAGFMETGETTEQGALRETLEEAGARVQLAGLYSLIDVPHVEQVHLFYRGQLLDADFAAGEESLEVRLFEPAQIPWNDLAFRTVSKTLRWFLEEQPADAYTLHTDIVTYPPKPALATAAV
jgi:ADP-ribose pyrophosphatase YjhB (NUDIX family)